MRFTGRTAVAVIAAAFPLAACVAGEQPIRAATTDYEVWIIDQSDTPGLSHGGTLHIFAGETLRDIEGAPPLEGERHDLGVAAAELCHTETGAYPVRPHMVLFNAEETHAAIAFVASGHVLVIEAATRRPLACLRTSRSPTGQQAHAAYPSPDGSYLLVANQNGKRLERIRSDYASAHFTHDEAATLDLATCTTPSGAPCEAPGVRPDNAPICPIISDAGDRAFVTLRGGGMLVVDPTTTPMRIVAEYDMATVKGNGCGGVEVGGRMYVNSGGRPGPLEHLHLFGFDVYRFELDALRAADGGFAVNTPAPATVLARDGEHDSHGMVATLDGRYLWVMDRHADVAEVVATRDGSHVTTVSLNGELTANAAPDLVDGSPAGDQLYVALRGPTPLSGDPHVATGSTPGLGVIRISDDGRDGRLAAIIRLTNVGEDGVERADPHGVRVRRR